MRLPPAAAAGALLLGALLAWGLHAAMRHAAEDPARLDARLLDRFAALEPLEVGDEAEALYVLDDDGRPTTVALPRDGRPVVVWFWSVGCRCVRECEERIVTLLERYGPRIHFFAVDSNPHDTRADIDDLRASLDSPYDVLRDARGTTARRLGVRASASVAVLDGEGRVRFRGAIDDDRYEPQVSYVHQTLDALLAGQPLDRTTARSYGCRFPVAEATPTPRR